MSIKSSEYSKKETAYRVAVSRLKDVAALDNLPQELKDEVNVLISFFKTYDMEQHKDKGIKLTGEILSQDEVLSAVIDATGYKKWSIFKDDDFDPKWIINEFNLNVKEDDIVEYRVDRSTNSRNDIFMVTVICLPGCVYVGFDTGRADAYIEHLIPNADIRKEIEANFD
jgi:hypothetical protein